MLILLIVLSLVNAGTLSRVISRVFNRLAILILLYSVILGFFSLINTTLDNGIGIYGGLFRSTSIIHISNLFISIIGAIMLLLTSLRGCSAAAFNLESFDSRYPFNYQNTDSYLERYKNNLIMQDGRKAHVVGYPLIILFTLIGATFLMSSSDLVSMFLAIELQSYGLYF